MRKLILEEWMSLDGYVEDANGQLDFFTSISPEESRPADEDQLKFLEGVDLILLGRKTYELFVSFWPSANPEQEIMATKLNSIPKLVFSSTLKEAPWGKWQAAKVLAGSAVDSIRELKGQPGKDMVMWGSISLAQDLMREDLIDEYHIQLCPALTGGGRKLFPKISYIEKMRLLDVRRYNTGNVLMCYEPIR